ncbi:DinB family protein [Mucilaginibacter boryungensis]|uniref:DinB family protein n=1 Tax=Mucilaginibacter boryungensis TaxID=768480 RepID=A0ABR9XIH9_9SPHI|nr:DinB family protein [Mucilaginibacter boryungensis]MBE9667025.1 DinB family protein [Mucilaginibacter boryungensis]
MIPVLITVDDFMKRIKDQQVNWEVKPGPDKWSAKEIMGHLCDSAQINLQRFIRCTYEEGFKLVYFQNEWVEVQKYQQADTNDILLLWQLLNRQIQRVLDNYPVDRWEIQCDNNRDSVSLNTVEFLANDYVAHMRHHLNQVWK